MHRSQIVAALASGTILAGCASGPVLEQRIGQALPADVSASYDAGTNTVTLGKNGAAPVTMTYDSPLGNAESYENIGDFSFALRQTTAGGKGAVVTIASPDSALGIVGVIATRAEAVEVPTTGAANYSGGYTGLLARESDKKAVGYVTGTACLTADFGAGSIGGAIVGRSSGLADITIPATPLSAGGTFSGAITGGQGPGLGDTASNGQLSGMFADVAAGEIVGGLRLDQSFGGVDYYEVGGFTTGAGACP